MVDIKKVNQRIYEFDLKNCELEDGNELITTQVNEFVNTFINQIHRFVANVINI